MTILKARHTRVSTLVAAAFGYLTRQGLVLHAEGDPPTITPEMQALIDAAVSKEVTGLKAKNAELIGDSKKLKEQLARFDGIDPEAVNSMLKRFADDEEAGLIKAGKIDEVLQKRTERMRAEFQKQVDAAKSEADKLLKRSKAFEGRVLDDGIRAAAAKAGLHQHAIEDALFRGRSLFSLDGDGNAVQVGDDGHAVLGKDGKTPFSPAEWLDGMKEKAPHWFPSNASGGGAGGGARDASGKKSVTRTQFDAMPPHERMAHAKSGGVDVD